MRLSLVTRVSGESAIDLGFMSELFWGRRRGHNYGFGRTPDEAVRIPGGAGEV
jgi:hypothetical protein